jgi:hypothetical protein
MRKTSVLIVVLMLVFSVSTITAGGKYFKKPDMQPMSIEKESRQIETEKHSRFKGTHRLHRLKRMKSIRSSYIRMKRQHFIR